MYCSGRLGGSERARADGIMARVGLEVWRCRLEVDFCSSNTLHTTRHQSQENRSREEEARAAHISPPLAVSLPPSIRNLFLYFDPHPPTHPVCSLHNNSAT